MDSGRFWRQARGSGPFAGHGFQLFFLVFFTLRKRIPREGISFAGDWGHLAEVAAAHWMAGL